MSNNEKPSFLKGKGGAVAVVICFVAVIAAVGAYTFSNYQDKMEQQVAEAQQQEEETKEGTKEDAKENTKEDTQATTTDDIVLPETESHTSDTEDEEKNNDAGESAAGENAAQSTAEYVPSDSQDDVSTAGSTSGVWFDESSILEWPASGATLIGYSMDQTVYFSTLEQYKYNPALIIGGEVGEEIGASAPGVVSNIEQTAQTGTTVTLDMGNGYSAVYGQLKEVPVVVGDYLDTGDLVGYMSEPTKYYSVEGANLYFEILKDGEPVNPLDFME